MKHSSILLATAVILASCSITRIVTVDPAPEPVVATQPTQVVVVQQSQQSVRPRPVSTTVTSPRTHTTRTTTIEVTPLTSDISLYLDLQAVAAAFAQANTVEEFEMILNSSLYMISNLDLNRDGYIDYLRVLETLDGYTHVLLIQAVLAANIYQDVATLVVEMGYSSPYVQVIGAPYIYGTNYIIEPVYYKRPPLYDRFGRPTYAYWRSPYYWDHFPTYYGHHAPYHLGHYQAYVNTYMENHHYCHNVNYAEHTHYTRYADAVRPVSRNDYSQQYPEQSFSHRTTTATYVPAGSSIPTRVTNARQLQQAVEQSGATRTTQVTQPARTTSTTRTTTTTGSGERTQPASTTTRPAATTTTRPTTSSSSSTRTSTTQESTTTTRVRTSGTTSTTRTPPTAAPARSTGTSSRPSSTSSTTSRPSGTSSSSSRSSGTSSSSSRSTNTGSRPAGDNSTTR